METIINAIKYWVIQQLNKLFPTTNINNSVLVHKIGAASTMVEMKSSYTQEQIDACAPSESQVAQFEAFLPTLQEVTDDYCYVCILPEEDETSATDRNVLTITQTLNGIIEDYIYIITPEGGQWYKWTKRDGQKPCAAPTVYIETNAINNTLKSYMPDMSALFLKTQSITQTEKNEWVPLSTIGGGLTAGQGIVIQNGVISADVVNYTAGNGISIQNGVISVTSE